MYKQFSYTTSINTSERIYKIEEHSKKYIDKHYRKNILEINNIFNKDWLPTKTKLPLFSNIPLLSSKKMNMDYTLMAQRQKPKYLNSNYTKKYKKNYNEKYNLTRQTMKDNWRYIAFLYKNNKYIKKDLFCKISHNFMNIIDDKKKMWINANYSPNINLIN